MNNANSWFCAGFFFKKIEGAWYALGVTDLRFPDEVKALGGCKKRDEHPDDTLKRELNEETEGKLLATSFSVIHDEIHSNHVKYFYLVTEVSGELGLDEELKIIEPDGKLIVVKFWKLEEFSEKLFRNYHTAFRKVVMQMRMFDLTFPNDV